MSVSKTVQLFKSALPSVMDRIRSLIRSKKYRPRFWGRRMNLGEWRQIVDHLVIEMVHNWLQHLVEQLEVKEKARLIERFSDKSNLQVVVVPVRIFPLAMVVAEGSGLMNASRRCNFVH